MPRESVQTTPEAPLNPKAEQVLNAAQHLFTEHGFGATSMDAVAIDAAVSKATVYAHFANKERLFAAMVQRECRRCMEQMALPEDVHDLELRAALTRIARTFLDVALTPQVLAIFRVVIAEVRRFPELGHIFYDCGPRITLNGVVEYLTRARDSGLIEADDIRLAAYQFLGMLRGDLQLRSMLGIARDTDLKRVADGAVETFLRAYSV